MNEINKDELLDLTKWQRLFFMVIYAMAVYCIVVPILLTLALIQFLFYLFTSNVNSQLQTANNWLHDFLSDSLNFLSFNTDAKPWPFNGSKDAEPEVEEGVVEGEAEELISEDKPTEDPA